MATVHLSTAELTATLKQQTSGNKEAEQTAEKETKKELDEINQIGKKTGPKVVDDLLKAVVDVRPEPPSKVEQPV